MDDRCSQDGAVKCSMSAHVAALASSTLLGQTVRAAARPDASGGAVTILSRTMVKGR